MAGFFQIVVSFTEYELTDVLFGRLGGHIAVLSMDIEQILGLLEYYRNKDNNDLLHREWSALLPFMYSGYLKEMSFTEYCDNRTGSYIDLRSNEEIIAELEELHGRKLV